MRTDIGYVSVGIVFFQDDDEMARHASTAPRDVAYLPIAGGGSEAFAPSGAVGASPAGGGPGVASPTSPAQPGESEDGGSGGPQSPHHPTASLGSPAVEVLRGRDLTLSPSAAVDGSSAAVLGWSLLAGEVIAARTSGSSATPFTGHFNHLAPPGATWPLDFAITVALPEGGAAIVPVRIEVLVISPALSL